MPVQGWGLFMAQVPEKPLNLQNYRNFPVMPEEQ